LSDGDSVYSRETLFEILGSPENVFDMYRESGENLLEILAVVIISSSISFAIGMAKTKDCRVLELVRV